MTKANPRPMARLPRHRRGMALVAATIFLAIAALVLTALSIRSVTQARQVTQYVDFVETFEGTEAALAMARTALQTGNTAGVGLGTWQPRVENGVFVLPTWGDPVDPLPMPGNPSVEYMAVVHAWGTDGIDNTGDGLVDAGVEEDTFVVHAFARQGAIQRQTEMVVRGFDVNVWRNAIFGGAGQAGGLVNGNVRIHGSIHLLGENILPGNTAVAAMDLSGTSLVRNNYTGLSNDLRNRIAPPPTTLVNGELVETLNANLRVRAGRVGLSGNSQIGEPFQAGNGTKEFMDGTFVTDGWTGNQVTSDGGRGVPNNNVFADNGWTALYDLGGRVSLPILTDDWRDPFDGRTVTDPLTGVNYTHEDYFNTVLTGTPYEGNITIRVNQNFYYNATRPNDPNPANRDPSDDFIYYNSSTRIMEVNGQVTINGNLHLDRGSGNQTTINYTGRAALLVYGDVQLDVNLLAQNADGTTSQSFPVNNILGIMASNNMLVGSRSQLTLMGAFYAQNQIQTMRQTTVLGTFVSSFFDMGTNVPSIYQVPVLADNLPVGMIGNFPVLVFNPVSWREVGVP